MEEEVGMVEAARAGGPPPLRLTSGVEVVVAIAGVEAEAVAPFPLPTPPGTTFGGAWSGLRPVEKS